MKSKKLKIPIFLQTNQQALGVKEFRKDEEIEGGDIIQEYVQSCTRSSQGTRLKSIRRSPAVASKTTLPTMAEV